MNTNKVEFASRWGFILAAMGSAVGLGNIWRFTFMAGENGGGAFIFFYFLFIVFFGIPCLMAMIVIGRRGRRSPAGSTQALAVAEGKSPNWKYLGWIAICVAFLALTFFSVVAGWVLAYIPRSLAGAFEGISGEQSSQLFAEVQASVFGMTFWHGVFMLLTMFIVARGIRQGVEKTVKVMMPALFIALLILVVYAAVTGNFGEAFAFMFKPDFSKVNSDIVLLALGQAFFSLSVGGGGNGHFPHRLRLSIGTCLRSRLIVCHSAGGLRSDARRHHRRHSLPPAGAIRRTQHIHLHAGVGSLPADRTREQ